jgi:DNA-directed RNA polymerase subunit RPC12/RpoP
MFKNRLYKCEMPECGREVSIRSTIKTGEHKGKKTCAGCKHKVEGVIKPRRALKPFTTKNREKRKAERARLPMFFENAIIDLEEKPMCQNCGHKINTRYEPIRNIAHILPKSKYKSVMAHPQNFIFLCSSKDREDGLDCHHRFDNSIRSIPNMLCFGPAKKKFEIFKDEVVERGIIFRIFEEN